MVGLLGVSVVLCIGVILSFNLARQTQDLMNSINALPDAQIPPKDRADLVRNALQYQADNLTKLWTGIVQGIGAIVLTIGAIVTWRNLRVAQENARVGQETLRVTQDRLDVDRQAQITNRFTQAIGQLGAETKDGAPNLEVRLGGIYALERIARDSPRDHWTIMEVLTAYVRQNARWTNASSPDGIASSLEDVARQEEADEPEGPTAPRTDIQAILTVIGRRTQSGDRVEPGGLDLSETDLRRANFGVHLEGRILVGAHLEHANFEEAHLENASFQHAHLEHAVLMDTHMEYADLKSAHLEGATLWNTHLAHAELMWAHIAGPTFMGADLQWAILYGADLEQASLLRSDFRMSRNLTQDQVKSAASVKGTLLPLDLAHLEELDVEELDEEPDETLAESAPP